MQRVFVTFDKIGDIPLKAIAKDVNSNNQDIVIRELIVKVSYTVKPVNKGHLREIKIMVFIDKWSLYGGFFILFNQ